MEGKEPRPMKEIHEIRLRLYEEERGLSPAEGKQWLMNSLSEEVSVNNSCSTQCNVL